MPSSDDLIEKGKQWFEWYTNKLDHNSTVLEPKPGVRYRCPCCKYLTLEERGGYDICPVCFWEDDGQDDEDADTVRGGPNKNLSLSQARQNYIDFGASGRDRMAYVRPVLPEEM